MHCFYCCVFIRDFMSHTAQVPAIPAEEVDSPALATGSDRCRQKRPWHRWGWKRRCPTIAVHKLALSSPVWLVCPQQLVVDLAKDKEVLGVASAYTHNVHTEE